MGQYAAGKGFLSSWPALAVVALVAASAARAASAPPGGEGLRESLSPVVALVPGDLQTLATGRPVVKSLDGSHPTEIALLSAIRIGVSKDTFLSRFRDIARFKLGGPVLQIGKLSAPPQLADFDGLTLDPVDVDALRKCHPGDCHFALTTDAMTRVAREIDWSAPDAGRQAERWVRQWLLDLATAYLAKGKSALPVYATRQPSVDVAANFAAIVEASPPVLGFTPALAAYLRDFPLGSLPDSEQFLYWSQENVGAKPIISMTHVVIHHESTRSDRVAIASKQLYASHYLLASLGLTFVVDDVAAPAAEAYLVYLNRSRSDALVGFLGPLRRSIVRSRARAGAEKTMLGMQRRLSSRP